MPHMHQKVEFREFWFQSLDSGCGCWPNNSATTSCLPRKGCQFVLHKKPNEQPGVKWDCGQFPLGAEEFQGGSRTVPETSSSISRRPSQVASHLRWLELVMWHMDGEHGVRKAPRNAGGRKSRLPRPCDKSYKGQSGGKGQTVKRSAREALQVPHLLSLNRALNCLRCPATARAALK